MSEKKQTAVNESAKQKAVEIVDKFYGIVFNYDDAIRCGYFYVNGVIMALSREEHSNQHLIKEYQQVRSEIEKL